MSKILHGKEYDLTEKDLVNPEETLRQSELADDCIKFIYRGHENGWHATEKDDLLQSITFPEYHDDDVLDEIASIIYGLYLTNARTLKKWLKENPPNADIISTIVYLKDRYSYRFKRMIDSDYDEGDEHFEILLEKVSEHYKELARYIESKS
ncbi:MAG: hypothetical protein AAGE84_24695 [Cyanobacteria bacterium P01_G01_bin.39]